jgi:hypothetical protein
MKHALKSLKPQAASKHQTGLPNLMRALKLPRNRKNLLRVAFAGQALPDPLPAEIEATLPEDLHEDHGTGKLSGVSFAGK